MAGKQLTDIEIDALKEIGNIGSGNASVKISKMISERVDIEMTEMNIISSEKLLKKNRPKADEIVLTIFLRVVGDVFGGIVTMLKKESAARLVDLINKKPIGTTKAIDKAGEERLRMVGICLAQSYIDSLSEFLGIDLKESDSVVQINKKEVIINFMIGGVTPSLAEDVLLLKTKFTVLKYGLEGEFFLLFGLKSVEEFKNLINKKMGG